MEAATTRLSDYATTREVDRGTEARTGRRQPERAWARKIAGSGRYFTRLLAADPPSAASAAPIAMTVPLDPRRLAG
ncbi:MAG TPA: hypothetical protein VFW96_03415 [Thermomicrobiales bacterium]|nr:hypothetical protein [Thermomicrobiales bacterium]